MVSETASSICRARSRKNNKCVIGFYAFIPSDGQHSEKHIIYTIPQSHNENKLSEQVEVCPETVSHYTGILDSNLEPVFDHDKANVISDSCTYPLDETTVSWSESDYCWQVSGHVKTFNKAREFEENINHAKYLEVIGIN